MKPQVIVLISGSGTNLQALMDAVQNGDLEAEIALVVSNRKAAFGLERAKSAGIPTLYFPLKPYKDAGKSREDYDADLAKTLEQHNPDLLVLAGWMHIDSGALCQTFLGRIINLHPALPNEFAGAHAIEDAFAAWQKSEISRSGCMVHHVIPELDAGEAIVTREVPFIEGDTLETFAARVHTAEHKIIVEATRKILKELIYKSVVTQVQQMHSKQVSLEEILRFIRAQGFWQIDTIRMLRDAIGMSIEDGKQTLYLSNTWADIRPAKEKLDQEIEDAIQEINKEYQMT